MAWIPPCQPRVPAANTERQTACNGTAATRTRGAGAGAGRVVSALAPSSWPGSWPPPTVHAPPPPPPPPPLCSAMDGTTAASPRRVFASAFLANPPTNLPRQSPRHRPVSCRLAPVPARPDRVKTNTKGPFSSQKFSPPL
ncbi:hypothetical protein PVAP13_1NG412119 [Panicum virgatum]|uniref:Uncharacterized protein n=1 Tax=Panicum virgatum TaxID=38727 RepID=A0A8T0X4Y8_PANVG|nr:hypothetical protein PVAP13_1NG412119 [Panicum virgatum]